MELIFRVVITVHGKSEVDNWQRKSQYAETTVVENTLWYNFCSLYGFLGFGGLGSGLVDNFLLFFRDFLSFAPVAKDVRSENH